VIREDGDPALRIWAIASLVEDRTEHTESYHQFLQILRQKVNA
jgi:protein transport protein SEC24